MKRFCSTTGLILGCLIAFPACVRAQDAKTVEPFLHGIYDRYKASGAPVDISGPEAAELYDPDLLALIRADQKAVNGEAGVLDADPICACQDHDIRAVKLSIRSVGVAHVEATATFKNLGTATVIRFDLVAVDAGWRIADIHEKGVGSLKKALADEIAAAKP